MCLKPLLIISSAKLQKLYLLMSDHYGKQAERPDQLLLAQDEGLSQSSLKQAPQKDSAPTRKTNNGPHRESSDQGHLTRNCNEENTLVRVSMMRTEICSKRLCSCLCHRRSEIQFKALEGLVRSLMVGYNAFPFASSACGTPGCGRQSSYANISYAFPKWFSSRVLLAKISDARVTGPEFLIKTRWARPLESLLYLRGWPEDEMYRERLSRGQLSLRDTDLNGRSLLCVSRHIWLSEMQLLELMCASWPLRYSGLRL